MAFKLVAETKLNGRTAVHKYLSERTGLRVVFGDVDGPICNGYFVLGMMIWLEYFATPSNDMPLSLPSLSFCSH